MSIFVEIGRNFFFLHISYRYKGTLQLHTAMKMNSKIEQHLMVNTRLMKITGVYQILCPHVRKVYGFNLFACIIVIHMINLTGAIISFASNLYYCIDDLSQISQYFMVIVAAIATVFKMYVIKQRSETIWNCMQLTSMKFLSYEHHDRRTLETGRTKSKLFSTIFTYLWLGVMASWILAPFVLSEYHMRVKVDNDVYYSYRFNVLNLVFPVSDKFYNKNFLTYYCIESIITVSWGHGVLIFDIILISMCITFTYQLKAIRNSYSTYGYALRNHSTSKSQVCAALNLHAQFELNYVLQETKPRRSNMVTKQC